MANTIASQVQALYVGYLGRAADQAGLDFWTNAITAGTSTLQSVALGFTLSPEYTALYAGKTNEELAAAVYQNVLGRAADADGLAFWVGELTKGVQTPETLLAAMLNSLGAVDQQTISNKVFVANTYTVAAGAQYDAAQAKALIASVDSNISSVTDAISKIEITPSYSAASLKAVADAQEAVKAALVAYSNALVKANLVGETDADEDGVADGLVIATDYVALAQQKFELATAALASARASASDAAVTKAVADAQAAINASTALFDADGGIDGTGVKYTLAQLQARDINAQNALAAHIAANGATADLAAALKDAIALFVAKHGAVGALTALNAAVGTYLTAIDEAEDADDVFAAENAFFNAVDAAATAVFSGTNSASILADGARGDVVEAQLKVLDLRNDRFDAAANTSEAFEVALDEAAINFKGALDAQQARIELIKAVSDANLSISAVSDAATAYEKAALAAQKAAEALGFDVEDIDSAVELATSKSDLFIFQAKDLADANIDAIIINGLSSKDVIVLGEYALGGTQGNNNVLEVFLKDVDGNAVLQIENSLYGSAVGTSGDFTTITLTGVSVADVTIQDGVVTFA